MHTPGYPERLIGNTISIQPLAIPDGPYFGRQTLRVFADSKRLRELPRRLGYNNHLWHLTASLDERDSMVYVDPIRQMGNLIVVSSVEGVREICDNWVKEALEPVVRKGGSIIECDILNIHEQPPAPNQPYASFTRQYEIDRNVHYSP